MALKRKTHTNLSLPLPAELDDSPGTSKMTWEAESVSTGTERSLGEIMLSFRWTSIASTHMVQAWLSYVDTDLSWQNEKKGCKNCKPERIFPKKGEITFADFVEGWDSLADEIHVWILDKVVWKVNPHWRPDYWPEDDEPEEDEKKVT